MELANNYAIVKAKKNLERRKFGSKRGDRIILHPIEAVYLVEKGLVSYDFDSVVEWAKKRVENFPVVYLVYRDLRERGNRVRILDRYLVSRKAYMPVSEREKVVMPDLAKASSSFENFVLAVVDEESDITYLRVRKIDPTGEQEEEMTGFEGYLFEDRVLTDRKDVHDRYFYGSDKGDFVSLSLLESVYLVEKGVLTVRDGDRVVSFEEMFEIASRIEEDFERKFEVYKDLKERKFVVKTGFKFGSDFRVYSRVESVEDLPHSEYLVEIADERKMKMSEILRSVRLAHSVRKKMLFTYKAENREYLQIEWVRV